MLATSCQKLLSCRACLWVAIHRFGEHFLALKMPKKNKWNLAQGMSHNSKTENLQKERILAFKSEY